MKRFFLIGIFMLAGVVRPAFAVPTMDIIQNLSFGQFAVRNNDAVHTIIVETDNTVTVDPDLIAIIDAQRGEYLLEVLPPSSVIGIAATAGTLSDGAGPTFSVTDYTFNDPVTTDGAGSVMLYLGATLSTDGTGNYYDTGNYTGSIEISLTY
jgi:hypothetical protein